MSTKCQIKVKGSKVFIYKHSDGYPSDVMPTLKPFVKRFMENIGFDVEYMTCQIVRAFAVRDYKDAIKNHKEAVKKRDSFAYGQDYLGWGLDCVKHDDIEYLYEITNTGKILINGKTERQIELENEHNEEAGK